MNFPKDLEKGGTIGMIAPSFGIAIEPYISRYNAAKKRFMDMGYKIIEAPSVYRLEKGESNSPKVRAKEFMDMYLDPEVDILFSVAGGELMITMLDYLDFDKLKGTHKYFIGYSDNTVLTFLLTVLNNTLTIYGQNVPPFGMRELDISLIDELSLIKGEKMIFNSYDKYQIEDLKDNDYLMGFNKSEEVKYISYNSSHLEGILLGGCLDVLVFLVGTKYDKVKEFCKEKKILWYLEACELSPVAIKRSLWKMKSSGWFDNASGFIFGRSIINESFGLTDIEAARDILGDVPMVFNADIGHLPPTIPVLNGAYGTLDVEDNKGRIKYEKRSY